MRVTGQKIVKMDRLVNGRAGLWVEMSLPSGQDGQRTGSLMGMKTIACVDR